MPENIPDQTEDYEDGDYWEVQDFAAQQMRDAIDEMNRDDEYSALYHDTGIEPIDPSDAEW